MLQGEFLAAAQIVVYAGAVMVLYVFAGVAYVGNVDEPLWEPIAGQSTAPLLGVALFVELAIAKITGSGPPSDRHAWPDGRARLRLALGDRQAPLWSA